MNTREAALRYAKHGWQVLPVNSARVPLTPHGVYDASSNAEQIAKWFNENPDAGIAVRCGTPSGIVLIDIDPRNGGDRAWQLWAQDHAVPETLAADTPRGGFHLCYLCRGEVFKKGELMPGVDCLGEHSYAVLAPSLNAEVGVRYKWRDPQVPISDLSDDLLELLRAHNATSSNCAGGDDPPPPQEKIAHPHRHPWLRKRSVKYAADGDGVEAIFAKLKLDYSERCESGPKPITDQKLRDLAESAHKKYAPREETKSAEPPASEPATEAAAVADLILGREDSSNAERFCREHGENVRFWHTGKGRGKWLLWSGTHWEEDVKNNVFELAKQTARNMYLECATLPDAEAKLLAKWVEKSLNTPRLRELLANAASDPRIALSTEELDRDPFAANFLDGTVDTRTGEIREHNRLDFITKVVRAKYSPGLIGPRWDRFLTDTFGEMAGWVQKAVGYSITGDTREKVVFLLLGKTDAGKSTFLTVLRELFGDYSKLLQIETLMWSKHEDNNTNADLADLRGARFVTTSEVEEGQRLRESKLKRITQGMGVIKATRKFENPIEFRETHKLWIDANFAPVVRGVDNSIWNRLLPVPCMNVLDKLKIDRELKNKLHAEDDAIAAWAVMGAVEWFREGLAPIPSAIEQRRGTWRKEMDALGDFLAEWTDQGEDFSILATDLFKKYQEEGGTLNQTVFGLQMGDRGFDKKRQPGTGRAVYLGLKLKGGLF